MNPDIPAFTAPTYAVEHADLERSRSVAVELENEVARLTAELEDARAVLRELLYVGRVNAERLWLDRMPRVLPDDVIRGRRIHRGAGLRNGHRDPHRVDWGRGEVSDQLELIPHARLTDPATSHAAAAALDGKTMLRALVRVYKSGDYTAEEAARIAGLDGSNHYTKRISDALRLGWLEDTGTTRPGSSGRAQRVLAITDEAWGLV